MAKIVVMAGSNQSWVHPIGPDPFVEGLSNALARMGNNVELIVVNELSQVEINKEVVSYDPDLIISFNGAGISKEILKRTICPVAIELCDSIYYLLNVNLIEKELDRFYFISGAKEYIEKINDFFPDVSNNHVAYLGHVTDVRKKDIEQDIPISFVGSLGNFDKSFEHYWCHTGIDFSSKEEIDTLMKTKELFQNQAKAFFSNPLDASILDTPALPDFFQKTKGGDYARALVILRTCNLRYAVLDKLTDLGLKIYSVPFGMPNVIRYNFKMFECFDFTPSVTLADSETTFSRSRISLNLPHGQTLRSFSWRVPDILASNACLLSNYVVELKELMTGYIDMPMYESPAEARELAQKLLKDDVWCKEIVLASQQMIEDKCRFEHRLRKVAEKTGLKLEASSEIGSLSVIRKQFKLALKEKIRYRIYERLDRKTSLSLLERKIYDYVSEKLIKKNIIKKQHSISTAQHFVSKGKKLDDGQIKFVPFDRTFLDKSFVWLTTEPVKTLTISPSFTKEQQLKWFEGLISQKDYFIQGILYDEIPVGSWGLKHITKDSAEYFGYIGERDYWGKGIGRKIMQEAIKKAKQLNLREIYLKVLKNNTPAICLYKKYGFNMVNEDKKVYNMTLFL